MQTTRTVALLLRLSALTFALLLPALVFAGGQKIKPAELVEKHLASIGTAEARAAVRNRVAAGDADVVFRLGAIGQLSGTGTFLSEGPMIRLGMTFNAVEYPGELFGFDGKKVTVAQIQPGVRSPFGNFVYTYDALLKEGLLGGTISTAWPLLDLAHRQPKLQYTGLKKIEGKQLHELKYEIKKGGTDLQVALYFDPESFRHVRSQYTLSLPEAMGGSPEVSSLVETFDNFKEVDGLTLPHAYKIILQRGGYLAEWNFAVTQVMHNKQIDPKLFVVQ
jgi:hypothetical protein